VGSDVAVSDTGEAFTAAVGIAVGSGVSLQLITNANRTAINKTLLIIIIFN
jgi:hypothetical protein